jgi:hypothetical protein
MPADLRIAQLVTDPYRPEPMVPFRFMVECATVGDDGTGPFVVSFELDQAESVELPVHNVAPHESEWASWPHGGLRAGDHHIYCLLDAAHAVPEPEARRNQQSLYFKVAKGIGPPQDEDGDEYYDDQALADAVSNEIRHRVNQWLTFAVQAVEEWGTEAKQLVAEYNDTDATVDPSRSSPRSARPSSSTFPGSRPRWGS